VSLNNSSSSTSTSSSKPVPSSPIRVGVVFAGRPAPGGHCVVTGLFDFLADRAPGSTLLGFVSGTKGLFEQSSLELTSTLLESYRNQVRTLPSFVDIVSCLWRLIWLFILRLCLPYITHCCRNFSIFTTSLLTYFFIYHFSSSRSSFRVDTTCLVEAWTAFARPRRWRHH
jgi:hypothetical protein